MALEIRDLTKTYSNGVRALGGVSLSIPRGMFGLLGPNGAGKSTLMRILATLQEADGGTARFDGEIDVLREKDRVRRILGYLPQEFGVYPKVSAEDMLDHFALLKGVSNGAKRKELVRALLVQTNLWDARMRKLGGFSGGMRQRFGIAVALIGNPRLIIVDEPTAGLDPAERVRFLNLLSELGENAVVILSTHIVEDVAELCPRMAVISHGRILVEATPLGAVAELQGKVWRRIVHRDHLPELQHRLPVISTRLVAGQTAVRVLATEAPDPYFQPAEPGLEDVYFTVMRGIPLGHVPPPAWPVAPVVTTLPPAAPSTDGSVAAPSAAAPTPATHVPPSATPTPFAPPSPPHAAAPPSYAPPSAPATPPPHATSPSQPTYPSQPAQPSSPAQPAQPAAPTYVPPMGSPPYVPPTATPATPTHAPAAPTPQQPPTAHAPPTPPTYVPPPTYPAPSQPQPAQALPSQPSASYPSAPQPEAQPFAPPRPPVAPVPPQATQPAAAPMAPPPTAVPPTRPVSADGPSSYAPQPPVAAAAPPVEPQVGQPAYAPRPHLPPAHPADAPRPAAPEDGGAHGTEG